MPLEKRSHQKNRHWARQAKIDDKNKAKARAAAEEQKEREKARCRCVTTGLNIPCPHRHKRTWGNGFRSNPNAERLHKPKPMCERPTFIQRLFQHPSKKGKEAYEVSCTPGWENGFCGDKKQRRLYKPGPGPSFTERMPAHEHTMSRSVQSRAPSPVTNASRISVAPTGPDIFDWGMPAVLPNPRGRPSTIASISTVSTESATSRYRPRSPVSPMHRLSMPSSPAHRTVTIQPERRSKLQHLATYYSRLHC